MKYQEKYNHSITNKEQFWAEQSDKIAWFKKPKTILSKDENGFYRWFEGGKLNTAYLALDYHVENGRGEQNALIYDSPVTHTVKKYTFRELLDEVAKLAGGLKSLGP
jgi:hypothetical protein